MPAPDEVQHHVGAGVSAGTGEAVAAALVQGVADFHLRVAFPEAGESLPVHGDTVAVQQPGAGQQRGAGIDGPHAHTGARQPSQPV